MMTDNYATPDWHKQSYDRFLYENLPQLLADRLPLTGYEVAITGPHTCQITVTLDAPGGSVTVTFADLPYPDDDGAFHLGSEQRTVVPWVAHSELDQAQVKCVGELLYDGIEAQLGEAPANLPWDESLLHAWLPLDKWLSDFMQTHPHAQLIDITNWLSRQCHLRRIIVANRTSLITPGQFGRVDPFEMPEGPNLGRIFTIALGATIRNGTLTIVDDSPEAMLGMTSAMIPCLKHDDPNRLLMGANMMRQWLPYSEPEPALVQTGAEPNAPDFWCGRNLLTAFLPWGEDTFEDGIVLSESAARRLSNLQHDERLWSDGRPFDRYHEIESGDKLSNRHGTKGVVSHIRPDEEMPRLADGTPVDLVYSSLRLPGRLNLGQLREAVLGRIARHEGTPIVAPPFRGPAESEIRQRLAAAGLPDDGLEPLISGDTPLSHPSLVGWVYWGRTHHLAGEKMFFSVDRSQRGQRMGDLEVSTLRSIGAIETLREHFITRAVGPAANGADERSLATRLAAGPVDQASGPTPHFAQLQQRLAVAGIRVQREEDTLYFTFDAGTRERLSLAQPVPHPWLPEQRLTQVGAFPATAESSAGFREVPRQPDRSEDAAQPLAGYAAVQQANDRLAHLLAHSAAGSLVQRTHMQLKESIDHYLNAVLQPGDLRLEGRAVYTGRTVLAPGPDLNYDQIGLPDEMAWAFFGPQAARSLGTAAVADRTEEAARLLDEIMAESWIILHRSPAAQPTAFLAFHPVRQPERVVRLPSLACPLLNVDFDGDQVAIHLPITAAGQREAAERLSITGHLIRDAGLVEPLTKQDEAIWGLAHHSLTETGRGEICALAGVTVAMPDGFLTRSGLMLAMQSILDRHGADAMLKTLRQLVQLGFAAAAKTGFSMSPFVGDSVARPPVTEHDTPATLQVYQTQMAEHILAYSDFGHDVGPYVLGIKSGANPEAHLRTLLYILGPNRPTNDVYGQPVIVRNGFREGLQPADFVALIPGARAGMGRIWQQWEDLGETSGDMRAVKSFHVLARARRVQHPGIVFAQAAATGEVDPLVDGESRLFVGIL